MTNIVRKDNNAKQPTDIGSLQFQTSQRGGVIPLVYGTTRVAPNLIDYDDFTQIPAYPSGKKGAGKGGGGKNQTPVAYNYTASIIFGLCQGPIGGVGSFWGDKSIAFATGNPGGGGKGGQPLTPLPGLGGIGTLHIGTDGQAPDPFWVANHAYKAIGYSGTANISAPNFQLGNSAQLPNLSVEVISGFVGAGPQGLDASPADVAFDFMCNPRYGAGFPSAFVDQPALSDFRTYCAAVGLAISPQIDQQLEAQAWISDLCAATNTAPVWTGRLLKFIPYGDGAVSLGSIWQIVLSGGDLHAGDTYSVTFQDPGINGGTPATASATAVTPPGPSPPGENLIQFSSELVNAIVGVAPEYSIVVQGVTNFTTGVSPGLTSTITIILAQQISTGSTTLTVAGGPADAEISINQIQEGGTGTYTPNTMPLYSLTDVDFIAQTTSTHLPGLSAGGAALPSLDASVVGGISDDPVHIVRSSPADAINIVEVQYRDRYNNYNSEVVSRQMQGAIDQYGIRKGSSIKADMICDPSIATVAAQLALQRANLFRNTYTFRLGWKYCLIEPMDLLLITDLRLNPGPIEVRVTAVEEDDEGTLTITAEDFFLGYSSAVLYPSQGGQGYVPQYANDPGPVNTPAIFEPPPALAANQVWIVMSGGPNLGSAEVYVSSDGTSYTPIGLATPGVQGLLTADLPVGPAIDTSDTLAVDLSESRGMLTSVSSSDAAGLVSLVWVQDAVGGPGEMMSYQDATLTALYNYDLTTLYRGAYGGTIQDHPPGTQFAQITPAVFRFTYPASWVGQTIYFKFVAYNATGGGPESLATVVAYPFTLGGGVIVANLVGIENYFGSGVLSANQVANEFVLPFPTQFAPNFGSIAGGISVGRADVASTGTAVFSVQKALAASPNVWTGIGTVTYSSGNVIPTFATSGGAAQSGVAGDTIRIVAPSSPDATLAGASITLIGQR